MPIARINDINMYYEIHGKGEPLVFVPGMTGNVDWHFLHTPVFARYFKVIVFDNRGAGRTDAPDIPYTIKMMADDLAGLLEKLDIDSAHIQGASMGGFIAQEFALHYPERVKSLTLVATGFGPSHGVFPTDPEVIEAFQHPKVLSPEENIKHSLGLIMSRDFMDNNLGLINKIIEKMLEHPVSPQGAMRQGQAVMSFDTYDRLPEIRPPTLVIHGGGDRNLPVENARILASKIPQAELVILPKMGHGFQYEAFDESNRIILDFLKRHSSSVK